MAAKDFLKDAKPGEFWRRRDRSLVKIDCVLEHFERGICVIAKDGKFDRYGIDGFYLHDKHQHPFDILAITGRTEFE